MKLTNAQKEINENPLYWEWFKKWWNEDFSYESIISKNLFNESDLLIFKQQATYVRSFAGRNWHPYNIPPHDLEGNSASSAIANTQSVIGTAYKLSKIIGVIRKDFFVPNFKAVSALWCKFDADNTNDQQDFDSCLFEGSKFTGKQYSSCYFLSGEITAVNKVSLDNCSFEKQININTNYKSVSIDGGNHIDKLHASNVVNFNINNTKIKNVSLKVNRGSVNLNFPKKFKSNILIAIETGSSIILNGGESHDISIEGGDIEFLNSNGHAEGNLKFSKLRSLALKNCKLSNELKITTPEINYIDCQMVDFSRGISFIDGKVTGRTVFLGCRIFENATFDKTKFSDGLIYRPSKSINNEIKQAFIENASFEGSHFIDPIKNRKASCVNFNDATFSGSASFNKAIFDGVPKFHNAQMHSETSFLDLGGIPDIDGEDIGNSELYSSYQAAFRTLRQHMEKNNSSAMTFEFGRREMIAKQRRTEFVDVPKSEVFFTRWYGKLANYGQDFILPLKFLAKAWLLSVAAQFLVFSITSSNCYNLSKTCKLDWSKVGEAFERGTTFALPPFTLLTNRSIDSTEDLDINWFTDILSGSGMLVHAVTSSLLLFLFALGVKRKMQIK